MMVNRTTPNFGRTAQLSSPQKFVSDYRLLRFETGAMGTKQYTEARFCTFDSPKIREAKGELCDSVSRPIIYAPNAYSRFPIYCSVSTSERDKAIGRRNEANYVTFGPPVKYRGCVWVKCLSEFYEFNLD